MKVNATFHIEHHENTLVLTPLIDLGELESDRILSDGQTALDLLANTVAKNIVIDFEKIDYFGSCALGYFVQLWSRMRHHGGRMALCNLSNKERQVLDVTRLDTLWSICESRDDALRAVTPG